MRRVSKHGFWQKKGGEAMKRASKPSASASALEKYPRACLALGVALMTGGALLAGACLAVEAHRRFDEKGNPHCVAERGLFSAKKAASDCAEKQSLAVVAFDRVD